MKPRIIKTKAKIKKNSLLFVALLVCASAFSQKLGKNLIPNPGFEKRKNKSSNIKNAIPWQGSGTVDYYFRTDKLDTSRYKGAHTGTSYAGLRFQPKYREYMYVRLAEPLEKNRTYHFKMYVRLSGRSTVTLKQLGVYFSEEEFKVGMQFDEQGIIDSTFKKGISGTLNWIPIQGNYLANGGEKYIIIGNFKSKMIEDFVKRKRWEIFELREAYYYIDDVSLRRKITATDSLITSQIPESKPALVLPDTFVTGQVLEINNIQFQNGSAKLLKISHKALEELVRVLNDHPFMEIQISGHTDNQGNEVANKKLSKKRAKAVYDFLISEGAINPMTYKGFGSSQPVLPNDTDENKAKNRRVEMVIIKQ